MPLYYFHVSNGAEEPDEDGTELADLSEARTQAVRLIGEMLRFDAEPVWDGHGLKVVVSDHARGPLFSVKVVASSLFPDS